jgi:hypothetical protein
MFFCIKIFLEIKSNVEMKQAEISLVWSFFLIKGSDSFLLTFQFSICSLITSPAHPLSQQVR